FSDARRNLKAEFDRVVADADVTIITRRDAEDVVVMSLAEWNSWQETEYLLASPANARHLLKAVADLEAGDVEYHDLIDPSGPPPAVHEKPARHDAGPARRTRGKTHRKPK
ncbi:MAG TPA: type II toxin-antitoxin system prevent-host-death family antitoxin, partial [Rhodanobacteraceae bacterium]